MCNFAAKFANYDETASVFETPLLTILLIKVLKKYDD